MGNDTDDEEEDEGEFSAGRYKPILKKILQGAIGAGDPLSFEDFPSVMPMPESAAGTGAAASARGKKKGNTGVQGSARKGGGKQRWNKAHGGNTKGKSTAQSFVGNRTIVFTVGGMSYSEMRVARQVQAEESREIIFGSTAFVTATDFVDDLSKLS